jgi:hypothetical protein
VREVTAVTAEGWLVLSLSPHIAFAEGDTADSLFASIPATWRTAADAGALLQLSANSTDLPLRPGLALAIDATTVTLGADAPLLTLDTVAVQYQTTVLQLIIDCALLPILRSGYAFQAGGHSVSASAAVSSFSQVQQEFAKVDVDLSIAELAIANADVPGIFADGAHLVLTHIVTGASSTLASMAQSVTLQQLCQANTGTPNLFDAGALVSVGPSNPLPVIPSNSAIT